MAVRVDGSVPNPLCARSRSTDSLDHRGIGRAPEANREGPRQKIDGLIQGFPSAMPRSSRVRGSGHGGLLLSKLTTCSPTLRPWERQWHSPDRLHGRLIRPSFEPAGRPFVQRFGRLRLGRTCSVADDIKHPDPLDLISVQEHAVRLWHLLEVPGLATMLDSAQVQPWLSLRVLPPGGREPAAKRDLTAVPFGHDLSVASEACPLARKVSSRR